MIIINNIYIYVYTYIYIIIKMKTVRTIDKLTKEEELQR